MDNLKISLAGVKDTSGAIRVCNEQIYSALIEAKKQDVYKRQGHRHD